MSCIVRTPTLSNWKPDRWSWPSQRIALLAAPSCPSSKNIVGASPRQASKTVIPLRDGRRGSLAVPCPVLTGRSTSSFASVVKPARLVEVVAEAAAGGTDCSGLPWAALGSVQAVVSARHVMVIPRHIRVRSGTTLIMRDSLWYMDMPGRFVRVQRKLARFDAVTPPRPVMTTSGKKAAAAQSRSAVLAAEPARFPVMRSFIRLATRA